MPKIELDTARLEYDENAYFARLGRLSQAQKTDSDELRTYRIRTVWLTQLIAGTSIAYECMVQQRQEELTSHH